MDYELCNPETCLEDLYNQRQLVKVCKQLSSFIDKNKKGFTEIL